MMTDERPFYNAVAKLRNVAAFVGLVQRLQDRQDGVPGLATFYGPSGYGKSVAGGFASNQSQAYFVQVKSCWTRKSLCAAILADMSVKAARTVPEMVEQICAHLARTQRPLIIDEADYLANSKMIEIVRDIYEGSFAGIVLIGEETLPQTLQQWDRVHNRMMDWVRAEPAEARDVVQLARIYCPDIALDSALMGRLLADSHASVRRIVVNLVKVHEHAMTRGLTSVTAADWADQKFFSGAAPAPRRAVA
jgi:DNA transposition AAA+ family ATPase